MADQNTSFERHIQVNRTDCSATDQLVDATGLSRQRIKKAMQKGAVWHSREKTTRRIRRASRQMRNGDVLHIYYNEQVLAAVPSPSRLIADESAYSVWYKPYGVRSQGSKWGDHCTVHRWVESHLKPQRPAFVVHRLDRAATGLMLIAHGKGSATKLARLFQNRRIEKRYRAIVHGRFSDSPESLALDGKIEGKDALSIANYLEYDSNKEQSLLEVTIETGRKHQIRRHLAGLGFPVVGDRLYGWEGDVEDLKLNACFLGFLCPIEGLEKRYELPDGLLLGLSGSR